MPDSTGIWYARLQTGVYEFYEGTADNHPFETIDAFDRGDRWSLDIDELQGEYPPDPEDNSLVLIPKEDVDEVFFRSYDDEDGPDRPTIILGAHTVESMFED